MRDADDVAAASAELNERRQELARHGIVALGGFCLVVPGPDYVRLASEQEVDLILLDGSRPLLGGGVPRGSVGHVLEKAPCDVAVLVERQGVPVLDAEHPVMAPVRRRRPRLGGTARRLDLVRDRRASAEAARLGRRERLGKASRLLANASLVVQQFAGIATELLLVSPGDALI